MWISRRDFFRITDVFELPNDPIPEHLGKRGRLPHIPTERNRNEVKLLLAFGWIARRITQAFLIIGKPPTKYYFVELRQRDEAQPAAGAIEPCPRNFAAALEPRFGAIGRHSPGRGV